MIYPTSGISIFAHILVITTVKAKNFLGIKLRKKNHNNKQIKFLRKIFVSFAIAAIMESILFLVVGSSIAIIDIGIISDKSNFNIIKNALHSVEKNENSFKCSLNGICYDNIPDAKILIA